MKDDKYLLCRPLGGINDVLNQVEFCYRMAKRLGRLLIVETETGSSALPHRFGTRFADVFYWASNDHVAPAHVYPSGDLSPEDFHPPFAFLSSNRVSLEEATGGKQLLHKIDAASHSTKFLVHESWGGGLRSAAILARLRLDEPMLATFNKGLSRIPTNSVGLHLRAGDMSFDIDHLRKIREKLIADGGRATLFVSSDSQIAIDLAKDLFEGFDIASVSHFRSDIDHSLTAVQRSIFDLIALSNCRSLVLVRLSQSRPGIPRYSGFGRLAKHLWFVNTLSTAGLPALLRRHAPFQGLSNFRGIIPSLSYFVLAAAPRIIFHSVFKPGFYGQTLIIRE